MKNSNLSVLLKGLIKENPVFVLILGTCPTLATTTNVAGAFGMGIAALAVLVCSNILISLLRKIIPDSVRIPCYIVVIAGFVTIVQMIVHAFFPALYEMLGVYLPLITVNCIILGRAEMFAGKNTVGKSALDGIGMGLGFTIALTIVGALRELIGNGTLFGAEVMYEGYEPIGIFVQPPGAFLVLAFCIMILNAIGIKTRQRKLVESGCDGCCRSSGYCNRYTGRQRCRWQRGNDKLRSERRSRKINNQSA